MNLKTMFAALSLAALSLLGAAALPAQAQATAAASTQSAEEGVVPKISVVIDKGANAVDVAAAIDKIRVFNPEIFVKRAVDAAFEKSGGRLNVVMMNLSQNYNERLSGTRLYANIQWGTRHYGLWIAEEGQFTNEGHGGYQNWGIFGWWDRQGQTVNFHRP